MSPQKYSNKKKVLKRFVDKKRVVNGATAAAARKGCLRRKYGQIAIHAPPNTVFAAIFLRIGLPSTAFILEKKLYNLNDALL